MRRFWLLRNGRELTGNNACGINGICLNSGIPMGCGRRNPLKQTMNPLPSPPYLRAVRPALSTAGGSEGFLLPKNMIVSKIVNHNHAESSISELTVQGSSIGISESLNGRKWTRLQFDLHSYNDVYWLIGALTKVASQLKTKREQARNHQGNPDAPVSLEQAKAKFSKMRDMLMG